MKKMTTEPTVHAFSDKLQNGEPQNQEIKAVRYESAKNGQDKVRAIGNKMYSSILEPLHAKQSS